MSTKRAVLYARVSTDEQFAANQVEYGKEWATKNGYSIVGNYVDEGVSGTVPFDERAEGSRLLSDLRESEVDAVLVYKLDRLGRDPAETLVAIQLLQRAGASLVSMTEPIDNSSAGRLMTTILAGLGGFEHDNILQRSSDVMAQLARKPNYYPGGIVAYGYAVEGEARDAVLVVDEAIIPGIGISTAVVVRLIYKWIADDGRSTIWVAEELTRRGIPPRYTLDKREVTREERDGRRKVKTSGIWRPARIGNLVRNSTYKGVAVYGKRRSGKSRFPVPETTREVPAIVDADTWQRAQDALRRNLAFSPRNTRREYLLRGLVKCGACGLNYIGAHYTTADGEERRYYTCNGKASARGIYGERGERCPNPALSWQYEGQIWDDIDAWLDDPGPILDDLANQLQDEADEVVDLDGDIRRLERELKSKETERERLLTGYRKGLLNDDDLDSGLQAVRRESDVLEREIAALERASERLEERRAQLVDAGNLLRQLQEMRRDDMSYETRRKVVETLVSEIRVNEAGEAEVVYRFTPVENRTDVPAIGYQGNALELERRYAAD